jgi:hypothetical protein
VRDELAQMDEETLDSFQIRVVRAALHLAQDQPEDASAAHAPIIDDPEAAFDGRWMIQALLLGAIGLDALRDPGGASRVLERALNLAETSGSLLPSCSFRRPIYSNATLAFGPLTLRSSRTSTTSCPDEHRRLQERRSRSWSHSQKASSACCATCRPTCRCQRSRPSCSSPPTRSEHTPATCTTSSVFTRGRRPLTGVAS